MKSPAKLPTKAQALGLARLFKPRTIAVIGGGAWCLNLIEQCQKIGFDGEIWPVHPKKSYLGGLRAFASIEALPDAPDASFIGVNRDAAIEVLSQLNKRGAGGAVCFASGFSEAQGELDDGDDKQAALLKAAGDMKILGPNCYGFVNYLDKVALWPDQHGGQALETGQKGVALLTQSSNIAINLSMQKRGLPLAYLVTLGNQAQIGLSEVVSTLLQDPQVTALGLYLEGLDDLRQFEQVTTLARQLGKALVVLKVGKSSHAQQATLSHTASLAGSQAGAKALFRRLGVAQVTSLAGLLETLKLLHVTGPLSSSQIASMSCSGGEASLIADTAEGSGLCFPAITETQHKALRAALGPKVALANPLDYHTYIWGDRTALAQTFTAMMNDQRLAMGLVVLDFPRPDRCQSSDWDLVIEAIEDTMRTTGKPMAVLASMADTMPEVRAQDLMQRGIVPFSGMQEAIEALEQAALIGQSHKRAEADNPPPLLLPRKQKAVVQTLSKAQSTSQAQTLSEAEAKQALATVGVPVPPARQAQGLETLLELAKSMDFPLVLKGQGLAHKTEAGAVALNLTSPAALEQAARAMPCETFLIEPMVSHAIAELLVGVVEDTAHGFVLTLAAGGVLTELLDDKASLLVPASRDTVEQALLSLKMAPLFKGYRGATAVHMPSVLDAIMALQAYVEKARPQEVEINPLLCTPDQAIAVDALIRTKGLD